MIYDATTYYADQQDNDWYTDRDNSRQQTATATTKHCLIVWVMSGLEMMS